MASEIMTEDDVVSSAGDLPETGRRPWWRLPDVWAVATLLVLGTLVGSQVVAGGEMGFFYQTEFDPAVNLACGRGYVNTIDPNVDEFLAAGGGDARYDCGAALAQGSQIPLNYLQQTSPYLMGAVGLVWSVRGVAWDTLGPVFGLMLALTAIGLYGCVRLGMGPRFALPLSLLLLLSPLQRAYLPDLRDFSKAPFLLGGFFLIWLLALKPLSARARVIVCAIGGAVLGLGMGFRTDAVLILPGALVTLAGFTPDGVRGRWRNRLVSAGALVGAFTLVALPLLTTYAGGGNTFFWAVEGMSTPFTAQLDLEQDLYNLGYRYNDSYATEQVNAFQTMRDGQTEYIALATAENEAASAAFLSAAARTFPADFAARVLGSLEQSISTSPERIGERLMTRSERALNLAGGLLVRFPSVLLMAAAIAVLTAIRPRLGLLATGFWVGFAGIGAAQFDARHVFHLEVLIVLATATLGAAAVAVWQRARTGRLDGTQVRTWAIRSSVALVLLAAAPVLLLATLREVQTTQVRAMISDLLDADRVEVELSEAAGAEPGTTLLGAADDIPWAGNPQTSAAQIIATFDADECPVADLAPTFRYAARDGDFWDHTTSVPITLDERSGPVVVSLTVFTGSEAGRFAGVELPSGQTGCLASLEAVRDITDVPMPVNLTLPANWTDAVPYQTFPGLEGPRPLFPVQLGNLPDGEVIDWTSATYLDPGTVPTDDGFRYAGTSARAQSFLAVSSPVELTGTQQAIVEGTADHGVTVGLVGPDGAWHVLDVVGTAGPFRVAVRPTEPGEYSLVVANNLPADGATEVEVTGAVVTGAAGGG